jgi:outer membrane protein
MIALLTVCALAPTSVLTLADALAVAKKRPAVVQAKQNALAGDARYGEARSALLPQINGTAFYRRATQNVAQNPGSLPPGLASSTSTFNSVNYFSLGIQSTQLIYDSQETIDKVRAARATAESLHAAERLAFVQAGLDVRTAFFNARAMKALVGVAKEALGMQDRHLAQVEGFIKIGTRPDIDLAQSKVDRANAKLSLVQAEGNYDTAKAQLNFVIGRMAGTDFDVDDSNLGPAEGEDDSLEDQLRIAERSRPDLVQLERQVRAAELTLSSTKGQHGPQLSGGVGLTYAGTDAAPLVWNWQAQLTLSVPIFSGLNIWEQTKEADANLKIARAQLEQQKLQVRLDVEKARVVVRAAKEAVLAADEVLVNARERLRLAEGRYQAGVGNAIELGDAQLVLTQSAAQKVQAEYNLATARGQLLFALGRE